MSYATSRAISVGVFVVLLFGLTILLGLTLWVGAERGPSDASVAAVANDTEAYVGTEITLEGWYQGGSVRDKNPVCANTREGIPNEAYNLVYVDVPENATLYTGVKYRFTGPVVPSESLNRTVPYGGPVFDPHTVERLPEQDASCQLTTGADS